MDAPIRPYKGKKVYGIVYPLHGELKHPLSEKLTEFEGFYSLDKHTSTFSFTYPLAPNQGTVTAAGRCHALGTHIICGAYNLYNRRNKYAHVVVGRQTEESIAEQKIIMQQREEARLKAIEEAKAEAEKLAKEQAEKEGKERQESGTSAENGQAGQIIQAKDVPAGETPVEDLPPGTLLPPPVEMLEDN